MLYRKSRRVGFELLLQSTSCYLVKSYLVASHVLVVVGQNSTLTVDEATNQGLSRNRWISNLHLVKRSEEKRKEISGSIPLLF